MTQVEVRDLTLERGGFQLGPVDLRVDSGTATVLLGPSGAGKTTLLRALAGFLPLRTGTLLVDGRPVEHEPPERRRFGFVPPSLGLLPHRRVARNVSYPLDLSGDPAADQIARRWMERFGLLPLARKYPSQLSSGERQRVAMARALTAQPRFLLWDEPLSALDVESRDVLLRLVQDLLEDEGLPLLLVTHDPTTAFSVAQRIVVLEHGQVRSNSRPEELAAGPLDRFTARFLGYDNLFSRPELLEAGDSSLGTTLLSAAGPGGVVVPYDALSWQKGEAPGGHSLTVRSIRWTTLGWVPALQQGPITLRGSPIKEAPKVRVGDRVTVSIDVAHLKSLEESGPEVP